MFGWRPLRAAVARVRSPRDFLFVLHRYRDLAREVAQRYLDSLQSPSAVLVYVREACVDSSENYPDLVAKWGEIDRNPEPNRFVTPAAEAKAKAARKESLPDGRVGA